jgi:hypothetical protein
MNKAPSKMRIRIDHQVNNILRAEDECQERAKVSTRNLPADLRFSEKDAILELE